MINPAEIARNAAVGTLSDAMQDNLVTEPTVTEKLLENIHKKLGAILELQAAPDTEDIYRVGVVYKVGQGPALILNNEGRKYFRIFVGLSCPLDVSSILTYATSPIVTISAWTWTPLDLPDGSSITLDATSTLNAQNIFIRLTNIAPST